jgi:dihydrofolate reductase
MKISLISAMDRHRLIGRNNALPWHLPADFAHFKAVTMGKPVLMGRKTYDSIGRPLPGRMNIVLSRDPGLNIEGVTTVTSFEQAKQAARDSDELMVIGGSLIYEMLLPEADQLYLTFVDGEFEGDAWFPDFVTDEWEQVEKHVHAADEKNRYACEFVKFRRKSSS